MRIVRVFLHVTAYAVTLAMLVGSPKIVAADTAPFKEEIRDYSGVGRILWRIPVDPDFGCGFAVPHFTQGARVGCGSRDGDRAEISVYARDLTLTPDQRREKFIVDNQRVIGESIEGSLTLRVDGESSSIVYAKLTNKNPASSKPRLVLGYYVKGPYAIQFYHETPDLSDTRLARIFSVIRSAEPIDALPMLAWKLADYKSVCAELFPAMHRVNERAYAASLFASVDWMLHFREREPNTSPEQLDEKLRKARDSLAESLKHEPDGGGEGFCSAFPIMAIEAERGLTGGRRRGTIGVTLSPLTAELARAQGLSSPSGALVNAVAADSPAQRAGIKAGDVILRLADDAIESSNELVRMAALHLAGSTCEVLVVRNGERLTLSLTTVAAPD